MILLKLAPLIDDILSHFACLFGRGSIGGNQILAYDGLELDELMRMLGGGALREGEAGFGGRV